MGAVEEAGELRAAGMHVMPIEESTAWHDATSHLTYLAV
jgi:hypothetical protein